MLRLIFGLERLQLRLHFIDRGLVEQLAKIGAAEDFLELRLIDGERLRAPFGQRSVAFVYVIRDVGKQQRGSKRRRLGRFDWW